MTWSTVLLSPARTCLRAKAGASDVIFLVGTAFAAEDATHRADAGRAPPAGSGVARLAARHLSERARAESHARWHRAVRHSPAAAADRDGDRPQARANGRQSGAEHLGHRGGRTVHLRLRTWPAHAAIAAAAPGSASTHLALPRHCLVDFLDQDRGGGRARNGLHPARNL